MQTDSHTHLLFLEPSLPPSAEPIIDHLTRQLTGGWRVRETSRSGWRGQHQCGCGATSDNTEHWIRVTSDGVHALVVTNSLCLHYLAYHRAEVPLAQLALVARIVGEPADPTPDELGSAASRDGRREAIARASGLPRPATYAR